VERAVVRDVERFLQPRPCGFEVAAFDTGVGAAEYRLRALQQIGRNVTTSQLERGAQHDDRSQHVRIAQMTFGSGVQRDGIERVPAA